MRLTEERIAVLAREICDRLLDDELVDLEIDEADFRFLIEGVIARDLKIEDEIDEEATAFVRKAKPNLEEGSTEWQVEIERKKEDLAAARGYTAY
ncbi:MAG TPA: DUF507 family protein [Candidatus Krumholzibacteria bacterium]|nr:DUF507 family protein [Candidatus Krumholzibacteria bacterium]